MGPIHRNRRSHEPNLPESARIKGFCFAEQAVEQTPMGRDDDPDEDCWFRPVWVSISLPECSLPFSAALSANARLIGLASRVPREAMWWHGRRV